MFKTTRLLLLAALLLALVTGVTSAQDAEETEEPAEEVEVMILDDFEVEELFLGKDSDNLDIGFVAWGGQITLELATIPDDLALPEQDGDNTALQVTYNIANFGGFTHALTDGEEWVPQDWTDYDTFDFWLYGGETGAMIQVEIFDNRAPDSTSDTAERWFYRIQDDFSEWQFFSIPFDYFQRRADWQPGGAPMDDFGLTEVHGYAFSFPTNTGETIAYIDDVALGLGEGNVEPPPGVSAPADDADDTGEDAASEEAATEPIDLPEYDPNGEWTLVWSDEFEADAGEPINAEFWTCEIGGWGWGNNESQFYTDRTNNVVHDGEGNLVITAREESYEGSEYTSARCITQDKVEPMFGRIEARIDLPEGQGIWPAFWMLGAEFPETDWPDSGEIDIMEYIGAEPRSVHGTIHGPGYSGSGGFGMRYIADEPVATEFHVFAIEWEPDTITWTFNGEVYHTMNPDALYGMGEWVYNQPFFLLMNIAVGGNWPGYPDDTTVFPQEMLIDYVRVYQKVAAE